MALFGLQPVPQELTTVAGQDTRQMPASSSDGTREPVPAAPEWTREEISTFVRSLVNPDGNDKFNPGFCNNVTTIGDMAIASIELRKRVTALEHNRRRYEEVHETLLAIREQQKEDFDRAEKAERQRDVLRETLEQAVLSLEDHGGELWPTTISARALLAEIDKDKQQ